jgi:hypothetical protein
VERDLIWRCFAGLPWGSSHNSQRSWPHPLAPPQDGARWRRTLRPYGEVLSRDGGGEIGSRYWCLFDETSYRRTPEALERAHLRDNTHSTRGCEASGPVQPIPIPANGMRQLRRLITNRWVPDGLKTSRKATPRQQYPAVCRKDAHVNIGRSTQGYLTLSGCNALIGDGHMGPPPSHRAPCTTSNSRITSLHGTSLVRIATSLIFRNNCLV